MKPQTLLVAFCLGLVFLLLFGGYLYELFEWSLSCFFWLVGTPLAFVWNAGFHSGFKFPKLTPHEALACFLVILALGQVFRPAVNVRHNTVNQSAAREQYNE